MKHVPMPLEWHPAYADKTYLIDWLSGVGPYADRDIIYIPIITPMDFTNTTPVVARTRTRTLHRLRCWGLAPYVGRPFHYEWWAAVDELGRAIAGDSVIKYEEDS